MLLGRVHDVLLILDEELPEQRILRGLVVVLAQPMSHTACAAPFSGTPTRALCSGAYGRSTSTLATCADSQPRSRRLVGEVSTVGPSSSIGPMSESDEHSPSSDTGCRPQQRSMIGKKQGMAPVSMPKKPNDRTAMRLGRAPRSLPLSLLRRLPPFLPPFLPPSFEGPLKPRERWTARKWRWACTKFISAASRAA